MNTDTIRNFETIPQLLEYVQKVTRYHVTDWSRAQWYGGTTPECVAYVARGATEREQKPALDLLEKIDATVTGRHMREYVPTPAGAFPVVAEYLMGQPMNMRRRQPVENDLAPLRVVCEPLVSSGVGHAELTRRGAAIAALVTRLSETRAVELWASWGMRPTGSRRDVIGRVRLDNNPLSLGQLMAVFASPQFARGIMLPMGHALADGRPGRGTKWAWDAAPNTAHRNKRMREALGLEPQDIFIPGGYLSEADAFMRDPVAWVNKYLDEQRTVEE